MREFDPANHTGITTMSKNDHIADDTGISAGAGGVPREPDVQLAAMVPQSVKRAVRRRAEENGTTVRSIILRALKQAGLAEIDEAEIADRRAVAAALRAEAWRSGLRR
jgi:hypothetical protein